jgi:hypothetical protein
VRILTGPEFEIFRRLRFSPDGHHLAAHGVTLDGDVVVVWAVSGNGEALCKLSCKDPQSQNLFGVMFSADSRRVLVCNEWEWRGQHLVRNHG